MKRKIIIGCILVIIVGLALFNLKRHFLMLAKGAILFWQPGGEFDMDKSIDIWKKGTAVKSFVCKNDECAFKLYEALFKKSVNFAKGIKSKKEEGKDIWIIDNMEMVKATIDMKMIPFPLIKKVSLKEEGDIFLFSFVSTATFKGITINGIPYGEANGGAIISPGIVFIQKRLFER
ncbi:MAG: hypothetical protein QME40_01680 [bacterium]|nr:hypothetical protein [bacterium]